MIVRRKGLGFLAGIAGVLAVLTLLFSDAVIEHLMESAGSSITGAKVEFSGVDFRPLAVRLEWQSLQVANPYNTWRNLFETGYTGMDLALEPLFLKRFIVEAMQSDSVRIDTKRSTSGTLPGREPRTTSFMESIGERLESKIAEVPLLAVLYGGGGDVDSLWKLVDLQSPRKLDSLRKELQGMRREWGKRLDQLPDKEELQNLRGEIEEIEVEKPETAAEVAGLLERLRTINERIAGIRGKVENFERRFTEDIQALRAADTALANAIEQDRERIRELVQVPPITADQVAEILFGPALVGRIRQALAYIGTARYYSMKAAALKPEKEKPPRLQGQSIRFSSRRDWPGLWIKLLQLSGRIVGTVTVGGKGRNISTAQELIDLPIDIKLQGAGAGGTAVSLRGLFDYTGAIPMDRLELAADKVRLADITLSSSPLLPLHLKSGIATIAGTLSLTGSDLLARARFAGSSLRFTALEDQPELEARLASLRRNVVQSLSELTMSAVAASSGEQLDLKIQSDVAARLASGLVNIAAGSADSVRQLLYARMEEQLQPLRGTVEDQLSQLGNKTRQELQTRQTITTELEQIIQRKRRSLLERAAQQDMKERLPGLRGNPDEMVE